MTCPHDNPLERFMSWLIPVWLDTTWAGVHKPMAFIWWWTDVGPESIAEKSSAWFEVEL